MPGTTGGDVIKEFVVSIKYVVDDTALNQANTNINSGYTNLLNKATSSNRLIEGVLALGLSGFTAYATGVTGALGSIAVALEDTMKKFTSFYYTTQQLGPTFKASPAALIQNQLLSTLVGLSPDELNNQALALAKGMRDNPKDVLLNQFTHGEKDPVQALLDVAKALTTASKPDQYAIRSILRTLGLDPEALRQLGLNANAVKPEMNQNAQFIKSLGLGDPKNAQNAVEMQRKLDLLDAQLSETLQAFTLKTFPTLIKLIGELNNYVTQHAGEINKIANELPGALDRLLHFIQTVINVANMTPEDAVKKAASNAFDKDKSSVPLPTNTKSKTINIADSIWDVLTKPLSNSVTGQSDKQNQKMTDMLNKNLQSTKANELWIKSYIWDPFNKWLTGVTQSPNVEIAAADQMWPLFTNWLRGFSSYIPFVKIKPDSDTQNSLTNQIQDLSHSIQQTLGITAPTGNLTPQEQAQLPPGAGQPIQSKQEIENMKKAYDFYVSKGLTSNQAIGVVSRLDAESKMNPNAVNPTSGAYGIGQWLGPRKPGAEAAGGDLEKQLQYSWHEFLTTEKGALAQIKAAKTAPQAATAMESYERAGNPAFTQHAATMTGYISKQIATAFTDPTAPSNKKPSTETVTQAADQTGTDIDRISTETKFPALNKVAEHQGIPNLDHLSNLGKTLINGLAPLNGMGNTHYAFSPQTTVHVHGGDGGAQIGSKVAKAVGRTHANLYRNFQSQLV